MTNEYKSRVYTDRVETYEAITESPYVDVYTPPTCLASLMEGWE